MTKNILIKNVKIVDIKSEHNGKQVDVLIENGKIAEIKKNINSNLKSFEADNLHVSIGWFDLKANFCDPGFEYKEDIQSGLNAAQKGGFTEVAVMPSTLPAIDNKSGVEYLLNSSRNNTVKLHPVGAITESLKGENIAEMYDMHKAGAIAFTDNKNSIQHADLLKTALLYTKSFGGLIIHFPNDLSISINGQVNEGIPSTLNGLKGIPTLSEELMVARDLFLAEYCDSPIHLSCISTAKSVELIKKVKKNGVKVTCDVSVHNLLLDDSLISSFDSNFKTLPPLRSKTDVKALIKGVKNGIIDCVVSDHTPEDEENKKKEFDIAKFGVIGLESTFAALNTSIDGQTNVELISKIMAINPRNVLGLEIPTINIGELANLTFFNPSKKWNFSLSDIRSKSKNTPYNNFNFTGKALATFNNGIFKIC